MGGKKSPDKNRAYEKYRRERLNLQLEEINSLLPGYDPLLSNTTTEIYSKAIQYLKKSSGSVQPYECKCADSKKRIESLVDFSKVLLHLLRQQHVSVPHNIQFPEELLLFKETCKKSDKYIHFSCKENYIEKCNEDIALTSPLPGTTPNEVLNESVLDVPEISESSVLKQNIITLSSPEKLAPYNIIKLGASKSILNDNGDISESPLSSLKNDVGIINKAKLQPSVVVICPVTTTVTLLSLPICQSYNGSKKIILPKPTTESTTTTTFINKNPISAFQIKSTNFVNTKKVKLQLRRRSRASKGILVKYPMRRKRRFIAKSSISSSNKLKNTSNLRNNHTLVENISNNTLLQYNNENVYSGLNLPNVEFIKEPVKRSDVDFSNKANEPKTIKRCKKGASNNCEFSDSLLSSSNLCFMSDMNTDDTLKKNNINVLAHKANKNDCNENEKENVNKYKNCFTQNNSDSNKNSYIAENVNKPQYTNSSESGYAIESFKKNIPQIAINTGFENSVSSQMRCIFQSNVCNNIKINSPVTCNEILNKSIAIDTEQDNNINKDSNKENIHFAASFVDTAANITNQKNSNDNEDNAVLKNNNNNNNNNNNKSKIVINTNTNNEDKNKRNLIKIDDEFNDNALIYTVGNKNYDNETDKDSDKNEYVEKDNLLTSQGYYDNHLLSEIEKNNATPFCNSLMVNDSLDEFAKKHIDYTMVNSTGLYCNHLQSNVLKNCDNKTDINKNADIDGNNKPQKNFNHINSNNDDDDNVKNDVSNDKNQTIKKTNIQSKANKNTTEQSFCEVTSTASLGHADDGLKEIATETENKVLIIPNLLNNSKHLKEDSNRNNKNGIISNNKNSNDSNLSCLEELRLPFQNADFPSDLFSSLHIPSSGQHSESVSPTAAFLLTFPLVSTSKTADLLSENDNDSCNTNILNLENMDSPSELFQTSKSISDIQAANEENKDKLYKNVTQNLGSKSPHISRTTFHYNDICDDRIKSAYTSESQLSASKDHTLNKCTHIQFNNRVDGQANYFDCLSNKDENAILSGITNNFSRYNKNTVLSYDPVIMPKQVDVLNTCTSVAQNNICNFYTAPSFSNYDILSKYSNAPVVTSSYYNFSVHSTNKNLNSIITTNTSNYNSGIQSSCSANNVNYKRYNECVSLSDRFYNKSNSQIIFSGEKSKNVCNEDQVKNKLSSEFIPSLASYVPHSESLLASNDSSLCISSLNKTTPHSIAVTETRGNEKNVKFDAKLTAPYTSSLPINWMTAPDVCIIPENSFSSSFQDLSAQKDNVPISLSIANTSDTNTGSNNNVTDNRINDNKIVRNDNHNKNNNIVDDSNRTSVYGAEKSYSNNNRKYFSATANTNYNLSNDNNNMYSLNSNLPCKQNFSEIQHKTKTVNTFQSDCSVNNLPCNYSLSLPKSTLPMINNLLIPPAIPSAVCEFAFAPNSMKTSSSVGNNCKPCDKKILVSSTSQHSCNNINDNNTLNNTDDNIGGNEKNENSLNSMYMIWNPVENEKLSIDNTSYLSKQMEQQSRNFLSVTKLMNKENNIKPSDKYLPVKHHEPVKTSFIKKINSTSNISISSDELFLKNNNLHSFTFPIPTETTSSVSSNKYEPHKLNERSCEYNFLDKFNNDNINSPIKKPVTKGGNNSNKQNVSNNDISNKNSFINTPCKVKPNVKETKKRNNSLCSAKEDKKNKRKNSFSNPNYRSNGNSTVAKISNHNNYYSNNIIHNKQNSNNMYQNQLLNLNTNISDPYTNAQNLQYKQSSYSAESLISSANNRPMYPAQSYFYNENVPIMSTTNNDCNEGYNTKCKPNVNNMANNNYFTNATNFSYNNFHQSYNRFTFSPEQSYSGYQNSQNCFHHVIPKGLHNEENYVNKETGSSSYKNDVLFPYSVATTDPDQNKIKDPYEKQSTTFVCDKLPNQRKYVDNSIGNYTMQYEHQFNPSSSMLASTVANQNCEFSSVYTKPSVYAENFVSSSYNNPQTSASAVSIFSMTTFPQDTISTNSNVNISSGNIGGISHSATSLTNFNLSTIFPEMNDKPSQITKLQSLLMFKHSEQPEMLLDTIDFYVHMYENHNYLNITFIKA